MKNFILICVGIVLIIFENSILNYFKIFGFSLSILIVYISIIPLFLTKNKGAYIGLVLGLFKDIMIGRFLGVNALIFFCIGYVVGFLKDKIFKDSILNICIIVLVATIFDSIVNCFFASTFLSNEGFINFIVKGVIALPLLNSLVTFFIHDILRDFLEKIESF